MGERLKDLPRVSNQVVYLMYGADQHYVLEAIFSILSLLRLYDGDPPFRILVYTDSASAFDALPVEVQALGDAELRKWFGEIGYNHRAKVCALSHALGFAEKSLFIDTDTVFLEKPADLFAMIGEETVLVDELEGTWGNYSTIVLSGLPVRRDGFVDEVNRRGIARPDTLMVNSGLIGIAAKNSEIMEDVLGLVDSLYPLSESLFTIEQIALSFAIDNTLAIAVNDRRYVYHYHSRKLLMRARIAHFFSKFKHIHPGAVLFADIGSLLSAPFSPPRFSVLLYKARARFAPKKWRKLILYGLYSSHPGQCEYTECSRRSWALHVLERIQAMPGEQIDEVERFLSSTTSAVLLNKEARDNLLTAYRLLESRG